MATLDADDIKAIHGRPVYFVGPAGNDVNSGLTPALAKLTIASAKAAAVAGSLIMVLPGTYDDSDILKNDVDYYFAKGAVVAYTGAASSTILNAASAIRTRVMGHGRFTCIGPDTNGDILNVAHADARVYIEADEFGTNAGGGGDTHNRAIAVSAGYAQIRVPRIDIGGAASSRVCEITGGTVDFPIDMEIGDGVDIGGDCYVTINGHFFSHSVGVLFRSGAAGVVYCRGSITAATWAVLVNSGATGTAIFEDSTLRITAGTEPAVYADGTNTASVYLRRCLVLSASGATYSIGAGAAWTVNVDHHTTLNKAVGPNVTVAYGAVSLNKVMNLVQT